MAVRFDPMVIAADLAQCVCAALKNPARGAEAWDGDCCIRPGGSVAWDSCCSNDGKKGQSWVVLQRGFPTTSFPTPDSTSAETSCTRGLVSLALVFEIGVLRCVCADLCDCETAESNASLLFGDLQAILAGLNCCFTGATDDCDLGWRLNGFEMLGPEGGCGGSAVNITVHANYPCCPK